MPLQVGGVLKPASKGPISNLSWVMTLPELTGPPAARTVSLRPVIVTVSCASSTLFRTEYVQAYGWPICVGLVQPFVKEIPCWTFARPTALAMPVSATNATTITTRPPTPNFQRLRILKLPPQVVAPDPFGPSLRHSVVCCCVPFPHRTSCHPENLIGCALPTRVRVRERRPSKPRNVRGGYDRAPRNARNATGGIRTWTSAARPSAQAVCGQAEAVRSCPRTAPWMNFVVCTST